MPSFAHIEILGHVGREPEQRYTSAGLMLANFTVAVNPPGIRQPDGSYMDAPTDWFRVTCFGRTAERAMEHVAKGQVVHVRGRFKTDHWTGQDGTARTTLDISADSVTSLAPRRTETCDDHDLERPAGRQQRPEVNDDADLASLPF